MKNKLRHVDLCSGIGGFSLGFSWAELSKTIMFCDTEEWCRKILAKNFPNIPITTDVKELANDPERLVPDHDILTCGYPCQPFSVAGLRKGEEDDRHIWPFLFKIIACKRPSWVVCENVYGHVALGLDKVLLDLESEEYATRTFIVPACSKNAPHRRDRLWIIARNVGDTKHNGSSTPKIRGSNEEDARRSQKGEIETKQSEGASGRADHEIVENTNDHGYERGQFETRNETIARQDTQSLWSTNSDLTIRRGNDGGDIKKSRIDDGLPRLSNDGATKSSFSREVRGISEIADEHQGVGRQDRYQENDNRALVQEGQIGFQPSKYRGLGKDQASFERDQIRQGDDNNREQGVAEQRHYVADTKSIRHGRWHSEKCRFSQGQFQSEECEGREMGSETERRGELCRTDEGIWFAEPNICRVAHGIPKRVDRLRGLGNAIVPQLAMQIGLAIKKEIEK